MATDDSSVKQVGAWSAFLPAVDAAFLSSSNNGAVVCGVYEGSLAPGGLQLCVLAELAWASKGPSASMYHEEAATRILIRLPCPGNAGALRQRRLERSWILGGRLLSMGLRQEAAVGVFGTQWLPARRWTQLLVGDPWEAVADQIVVGRACRRVV